MINQKKKLIVIGVLVVAMLGVGIFQFTSGSAEPSPKPKPKPVDSAATPGEAGGSAENGADPNSEGGSDPIRQIYAQKLTPRDPFGSASVMLEAMSPSMPTPEPQRAPPVRRPRTTSVPPYDPLGGDFGPLPGPAGAEIQPGMPLPNVNQFGYRLSGIILGTKPAAVFTDEGGNQKLVALGSSIDGDSHLTGVAQGKATVRHRGKTVTLTVGGTPNAN